MAYVMLGSIYSKGLGVDRSVEKARQVLNEGVAAGFVWPLFELSKLEFKRWRIFESLKLRIRATKMTQALLARDPTDARLVGVNLPQ
jgi:TPR repeat protein